MKKQTNIRPIGLKGNDQIDRMIELMGKSPINENKTHSVLELTKLGPDGKIYGIVRENHQYFIKTAINKDNLSVDDFKYIGGLSNISEGEYHSYSKAAKQLNLKFIGLNESLGIKNKINILKNDDLISEEFKSYCEDPKPSQPDALMGTVKSIGGNEGHDTEIIDDAGEYEEKNKSIPIVKEDDDEIDDNIQENNSIDEKWDSNAKINNTGENSDKTIEELKKELNNIKTQSKKYKDKGDKIPENITKKEKQLNFAIRAKEGWPKNKVSESNLSENEKAVDNIILGIKKHTVNESTIVGGGLKIMTALENINKGYYSKKKN